MSRQNLEGDRGQSRRSEKRVSTPMNPAFMTSAPGKVIVYGEHAVVHGKAALAAAISLRSYLHVTTLSKSSRTITLKFPDIDFDHTWDIDDLPWSVFARPAKKKTYFDMVTELDQDLKGAIGPHLENISPQATDELKRTHRSAATVFLYLFLSLASQSFPGCVYLLRSTIPIGAGLGSSASIAVCLSSALLLQLRALSGPHPDQPVEEARTQIERINRWAFVGELCTHENPSGVDNTVSSNGRAVFFKRTDYTRPAQKQVIEKFPELPLLVVNTRQSRSTKVEVAKVAALRRHLPEVTELVLEGIDRVTETAYSMLTAPSFSPQDSDTLKTLGALMDVNHGLLVSLGVSHPRLDRIRELVDTLRAGHTKLTGAGGGGSAITLLNPQLNPQVKEKLERQLDAENFETFDVTLGGDGVGVLWPAVLGNKEIDMNGFLSAENEEEIETLVGANNRAEGRSWKFWKVSDTI